MSPWHGSSPMVVLKRVDFPDPIGPAMIIIDDFSSRIFRLLRTAPEVGEGWSVAFSIKMAGSRSMDGDWAGCNS